MCYVVDKQRRRTVTTGARALGAIPTNRVWVVARCYRSVGQRAYGPIRLCSGPAALRYEQDQLPGRLTPHDRLLCSSFRTSVRQARLRSTEHPRRPRHSPPARSNTSRLAHLPCDALSSSNPVTELQAHQYEPRRVAHGQKRRPWRRQVPSAQKTRFALTLGWIWSCASVQKWAPPSSLSILRAATNPKMPIGPPKPTRATMYLANTSLPLLTTLVFQQLNQLVYLALPIPT